MYHWQANVCYTACVYLLCCRNTHYAQNTAGLKKLGMCTNSYIIQAVNSFRWYHYVIIANLHGFMGGTGSSCRISQAVCWITSNLCRYTHKHSTLASCKFFFFFLVPIFKLFCVCWSPISSLWRGSTPEYEQHNIWTQQGGKRSKPPTCTVYNPIYVCLHVYSFFHNLFLIIFLTCKKIEKTQSSILSVRFLNCSKHTCSPAFCYTCILCVCLTHPILHAVPTVSTERVYFLSYMYSAISTYAPYMHPQLHMGR